jgi:epoxyqueuosine reductase
MKLSEEAMEQLKTNPARFIRKRIKEFVRSGEGSSFSFLDDYVIFEEPLVKFADGDDPIFTEYKRIIAPTHFTPREALAKAYNKSPEDLPARLSVISYVLPIKDETRKSNRAQTRFPSRLWSHTAWLGERFNDRVRAYLVELLTSAGYLATAPGSPPYFEEYINEKGLYSNWSERHIAYAAGQGTFSLSDGLITERGIAEKCGSVVTSLVLPVSRRKAKGPYANCLYYLGINCQGCINRCPSGAITEKGHDKNKCYQYLYGMGATPPQIEASGYDIDKSTYGCGLCQTKVPCEFQNPAQKLKKKTGQRGVKAIA